MDRGILSGNIFFNLTTHVVYDDNRKQQDYVSDKIKCNKLSNFATQEKQEETNELETGKEKQPSQRKLERAKGFQVLDMKYNIMSHQRKSFDCMINRLCESCIETGDKNNNIDKISSIDKNSKQIFDDESVGKDNAACSNTNENCKTTNNGKELERRTSILIKYFSNIADNKRCSQNSDVSIDENSKDLFDDIYVDMSDIMDIVESGNSESDRSENIYDNLVASFFDRTDNKENEVLTKPIVKSRRNYSTKSIDFNDTENIYEDKSFDIPDNFSHIDFDRFTIKRERKYNKTHAYETIPLLFKPRGLSCNDVDESTTKFDACLRRKSDSVIGDNTFQDTEQTIIAKLVRNENLTYCRTRLTCLNNHTLRPNQKFIRS